MLHEYRALGLLCAYNGAYAEYDIHFAIDERYFKICYPRYRLPLKTVPLSIIIYAGLLIRHACASRRAFPPEAYTRLLSSMNKIALSVLEYIYSAEMIDISPKMQKPSNAKILHHYARVASMLQSRRHLLQIFDD